jgi:hypothetical protein
MARIASLVEHRSAATAVDVRFPDPAASNYIALLGGEAPVA